MRRFVKRVFLAAHNVSCKARPGWMYNNILYHIAPTQMRNEACRRLCADVAGAHNPLYIQAYHFIGRAVGNAAVSL